MLGRRASWQRLDKAGERERALRCSCWCWCSSLNSWWGCGFEWATTLCDSASIKAEMLWSEPWLSLAASASGTQIPPPRPPPLSAGSCFRLMPAVPEGLTADWLTFVGSGLSVEAARRRVSEAGSLVAWLDVSGPGPGSGSATCLLRPVSDSVWRLEAFVARPRGVRLGELLLRHVMWHLWNSGGATLVFQWELVGVPALAGAWWRGWLSAAVAIERGWRWRRAAEQERCGFCPVTAAWIPPEGPTSPAVDGRPVVVRDASAGWTVVVADSGLCDGWGHMLAFTDGMIDWTRVAAVGGWRELWYRGPSAPVGVGWTWTGEWVVLGRVGVGQPVQTRWLTAELT